MKVHSPFIDKIWGADLADMQLISKFNKGFWPNDCVFVYELSGSGFESSCNHLGFYYALLMFTPSMLESFLGKIKWLLKKILIN